MKLKDLLGISLVSIFLFPVILIGIMLATGVVHLETGDGKDKERLKPVYTGEDQAKQEETEAKQLKAFKALELKEQEVNEKVADLNRETERLENLKMETMLAKDEIAEHRRKIEEMVGKSSEAQDKQIASLAEVYGGMRPDEAAPILLSLENSMVVRILKKIPETRATSKLMASLAALNVKRAAEITVLLGGKTKTVKPVETHDGASTKGEKAGKSAKTETPAKPEAAPKAEAAPKGAVAAKPETAKAESPAKPEAAAKKEAPAVDAKAMAEAPAAKPEKK